MQTALARDEQRACELGDRLGALVQRLGSAGAATPAQAEIDAACQEAQRLLVQRHHLLDSLGSLARELAAGLTDLAEDESWSRGQAESMQARLGPAEGACLPSVRSVRAAQELLIQTRRQQHELKGERREGLQIMPKAAYASVTTPRSDASNVLMCNRIFGNHTNGGLTGAQVA